MKHGRQFFIFCLTLILSIVTVGSTSHAVVQSESVYVKGVKQAKGNWCWAACAEMMGKTVYSSSTRDQYSVVKYLKGTLLESYPDKTGSMQECALGSQYVAYSKETFKSTASTWNFSEIATSISKGYPVTAAAGYYENGERDGGHDVVIVATRFTDDASGSQYYIDYKDPWDNSTHHCTFSSFKNGSYNGRKYDKTIYVKK